MDRNYTSTSTNALEYPMSQPSFSPTPMDDIRRPIPDLRQAQPETSEDASAAEREAKGELVQGVLAGRTIYVVPTRQWRASAFHALREGDLQGWAEATLSDDDWETWLEVDPTLEQIEEFFRSVSGGLGTDPGNSRASRRSSSRTRRR